MNSGKAVLLITFLFSAVIVSGCVQSAETPADSAPSLEVEEVKTQKGLFSFERNSGSLLGYRPVMETPSEGEAFAFLKLEFRNNGNENISSPESFFLDSSLAREEVKGYRVFPVNRTLEPNKSVSGWKPFEIPESAEEARLEASLGERNLSKQVNLSRERDFMAVGEAVSIRGDLAEVNISLEEARVAGENLMIDVLYESTEDSVRTVLPGREAFYLSNNTDLYDTPVQLGPGENSTQTYVLEDFSGEDTLKMDVMQGREEDYIVTWNITGQVR